MIVSDIYKILSIGVCVYVCMYLFMYVCMQFKNACVFVLTWSVCWILIWADMMCAVLFNLSQDEEVGGTTDKGGTAGSVVQVQSFDLSVQASALAVPAFVRLESVSSSEYGHQFCSGLQRGNLASSVWHGFKTLWMFECVCPKKSSAFCAFSYQTVHVFALEKENTASGQRIYLVTSYSELWHYYR